ncbi:GMC family oxidoreductase [Sinosporangium siamense]|uniref:GMC-type oxidoreductase n=1 Tax=Sinosporangium siamense TaxID=1367973 RepID=A0A919RDP2_9ACTN|nr:GMC family oxidoreductase N-terminal domain-containing protein [Sinosporangium siamense]GII91718.1 putative GMC-type oxidoreductase [Sinosporangium siamense]
MATEYDYVIVGAGAAGCVLAGRLSEDPGTRVALIEAGGRDDRLEIRIPAAFGKLFKTAYDWNYTTAPQPGLAGRSLYWPRGRTLGGSSSINAQMWVRGHPRDYDQWDIPGWSYEDVLPYFQRAEHRVGTNRGEVYGTAGPLHISELRSPNETTRAFLAACAELGLARLPELNGAEVNGAADRFGEGCAPTPVTQRRGRRWSPADAYLRPALKRPNLTLIHDSPADRVLFSGKRAVGVRLAHGAEVRAAKEVLLAGGAIGSPHLLMLSGVGDPDVLRVGGVDVHHDLPGVGRGLVDHLVTAVYMHCPRPVTLATAPRLPNLVRFLFHRSGPLTSNVGEAVAFIRTSPEEPAPDIELIFAPVPFIDHGLTPPPGHGITIGAMLLQPESQGRITLDEDRDVVIDPAYFSAEADIRRLALGLRMAQRLAATEALRDYVDGPMVPYTAPVTDEEVIAFLRERSETLYHPAGTCRMGLSGDAVVDAELRVHGLEGLRVVDASVMPTLNRGHTLAPVVMIAERAADLILREDF